MIEQSTRQFALCAALFAAAFSLSGCEGIKEQLGMTKKAPDEFVVMTKAPLVLPPDYSLRPPQPGAARPQEYQPREQAQAALSNQRAELPGQIRPWSREAKPGQQPISPGEAALLRQARAADADPGIRRKINEEFTQLADRDKGFVDRLIFWKQPAEPGTLLDAGQESQRLREAQAAGKAPTEGETPSITRKGRGILEGIF
jgi:Protein of unknown function (DUF3035)